MLQMKKMYLLLMTIDTPMNHLLMLNLNHQLIKYRWRGDTVGETANAS